jgi:hypothetical protein
VLTERLGILDDSIANTQFRARYDSCPEAALSDEEFESLAVFLFANKLHGSHSSSPSSMAAPTLKRLLQSKFRLIPRVTMLRRGSSGVSASPVLATKASMFSSSINVIW